MKSVNAAVFDVLFCERPVSFSAREKAMVCLETDAKHVMCASVQLYHMEL